MDHPGYSIEEQPAARGALKLRHLLAIAALAVAALVTYVWLNTSPPAAPEEPAPAPELTRVPEGSRTVTLYFAGADEAVVYGESRQVAIGRDFREQVRQVLEALLVGPEGDGVSAIPEGTALLSVFYDADAATLYLDFGVELVASHPGGSAAEYCTISAIMKTVAENFPEVRAVQLLVDGSQVETIAGHIRVDEPLLVRDWR